MIVARQDEPDLDRPYAGRLVAGRHRFSVRVYYEDTDAGGIVYHASYLRLMERARTDMLSLCGIEIAARANLARGQFIVADAALRFLRPATLGETLTIESHVIALRAAACVVQQNVRRDGLGVVEGRLTIAFIGPNGRPRRLPPDWIEALAAVNGAAASA